METKINNAYYSEKESHRHVMNYMLNRIINYISKTNNYEFPNVNNKIIKYMQAESYDEKIYNKLKNIMTHVNALNLLCYVESIGPDSCHISPMMNTPGIGITLEIQFIDGHISLYSTIAFYSSPISGEHICDIFAMFDKDKLSIQYRNNEFGLYPSNKSLSKRYLLAVNKIFEVIEKTYSLKNDIFGGNLSSKKQLEKRYEYVQLCRRNQFMSELTLKELFKI